MAVDTKKAQGRRKVHFDSYDDLLADAERLASGDVHMAGNWSLGQIFKHLSISFTGSMDGLPFTVPWYVKWIAGTFMKKKFLYGEMPSGFKIPDKNRDHFVPTESISTEEGLAALRTAVERLKTEPDRIVHPVLGKLTRQEWDNFNLRHAEMHLSFAAPH